MKIITTAHPAKLLIGIMFSDKKLYSNAMNDLKSRFGDIEAESKEYEFSKITDYYADEMGSRILKKFLVFKNKINKDDLAGIKLFTIEVENKYKRYKKRKVNIDPGCLTNDSLVLASFKKGTNYKEQISERVYAHKVLEFRKNEAIMFWHTFPDYREKKNQDFIKKIITSLI
ncbi:MAG: DUF4416 family protein [Candidatus Woesearchaeota archaeon]|nr:DUF4416 family protein [Candidatus Woesearchaeota archaeon]